MPMPVAFKHDGAIDHKATDAIIDFYLDAGVHGFFPLGTHGQGMVMEIDERKKVAEQIVNRVKGRVPVVMHIGTANTLSSIDLAKHAVSLGVDAVGVVPPYYYPHDDWEVYAHYKAIAKSVPGTPMFIYDNTETTWVEITPAKANKIIEAIAPNPLAGIKVSFIAYDKLLGYVYQLPKSVGVFPGGIFSLYTGYSIGVRGAIHPPSTPFPETCVKMYEALKSGDLRGQPASELAGPADSIRLIEPDLPAVRVVGNRDDICSPCSRSVMPVTVVFRAHPRRSPVARRRVDSRVR